MFAAFQLLLLLFALCLFKTFLAHRHISFCSLFNTQTRGISNWPVFIDSRAVLFHKDMLIDLSVFF